MFPAVFHHCILIALIGFSQELLRKANLLIFNRIRGMIRPAARLELMGVSYAFSTVCFYHNGARLAFGELNASEK